MILRFLVLYVQLKTLQLKQLDLNNESLYCVGINNQMSGAGREESPLCLGLKRGGVCGVLGSVCCEQFLVLICGFWLLLEIGGVCGWAVRNWDDPWGQWTSGLVEIWGQIELWDPWSSLGRHSMRLMAS